MKYTLLLLLSFQIFAHDETATKIAPIKLNDQCGLQDKIPAEQRLFNTIKWKTASEQDNFGYDIYRADTKDGEYSIITEDPLEGAGTTVNATKYLFKDDTIDPCKTYFYYVESISTSGVREAFTPKFQSKLKIQPK